MASYFFISERLLYERGDESGAKAYNRVVGKRIAFTCILIYNGAKVVVLVYAKSPEMLISFSACIERMSYFFKSEARTYCS
jgi:hypothetical protein